MLLLSIYANFTLQSEHGYNTHTGTILGIPIFSLGEPLTWGTPLLLWTLAGLFVTVFFARTFRVTALFISIMALISIPSLLI